MGKKYSYCLNVYETAYKMTKKVQVRSAKKQQLKLDKKGFISRFMIYNYVEGKKDNKKQMQYKH